LRFEIDILIMRNLTHTILTIIGTVALLVGILWFYQRGGFAGDREPKFTKGSYQAVFLSNGQVYFGKVGNLNKQYVTLTDTYYLIRGQAIQGQTPEGENQKQTETAFGLRKLGENEVHGPVDEMIINRDHILFVEELKGEGALVQAINRKKESLSQPTPEPTPTE